jgi:hypothetical protein
MVNKGCSSALHWWLDPSPDEDSQVEDIWFSNIQEVPDHMTLVDLIRLIQSQLCRCQSTLQ